MPINMCKQEGQAPFLEAAVSGPVAIPGPSKFTTALLCCVCVAIIRFRRKPKRLTILLLFGPRILSVDPKARCIPTHKVALL